MPTIFAIEKVKQKISAWSLKLNYWSPRYQTTVSKALISFKCFSQLVEIYNKFTQFERKLRKFTGRLNSKISVTCISCGSCQQLRLIFSLTTHQTTHGRPKEPIVFIYNISLYFNCISSVKYVFKWSHHGHIMPFSAVQPKQFNVPTQKIVYT